MSGAGGDTDGPDAAPVVVHGGPSAHELAALVVALSSLAAGSAAPAAPAPAACRTRWSARDDAVRRSLPRGPDAWRASGWPG